MSQIADPLEHLDNLQRLIHKFDAKITITNLSRVVDEVVKVFNKKGSDQIDDMDKFQAFINKYLRDDMQNDEWYRDNIIHNARKLYAKNN